MRIPDEKPVGGARPARGVGPAKRDSGQASQASAEARRQGDSLSVMGIPENELTPKVREAIQMLMAEVQRLRRELESGRARIGYLEKLADEDSLTPVINRRAFVRELSRMMAYAERYRAPGSVVYFDINGMKAINDRLGHAAGDAALRFVADRLLQNVRESDAVGRLGGDEFGVILTHADENVARDKGAALAAAIESGEFSWQGQPVHLSAAYGTFTFHGGGDAAAALDAADQDMYGRKQQRSPADPKPQALKR
jgi:diguanylate cyclase (GGDEF)-like protein